MAAAAVQPGCVGFRRPGGLNDGAEISSRFPSAGSECSSNGSTNEARTWRRCNPELAWSEVSSAGQQGRPEAAGVDVSDGSRRGLRRFCAINAASLFAAVSTLSATLSSPQYFKTLSGGGYESYPATSGPLFVMRLKLWLMHAHFWVYSVLAVHWLSTPPGGNSIKEGLNPSSETHLNDPSLHVPFVSSSTFQPEKLAGDVAEDLFRETSSGRRRAIELRDGRRLSELKLMRQERNNSRNQPLLPPRSLGYMYPK